jgi:hypothetical protein
MNNIGGLRQGSASVLEKPVSFTCTQPSNSSVRNEPSTPTAVFSANESGNQVTSQRDLMSQLDLSNLNGIHIEKYLAETLQNIEMQGHINRKAL